jgi:hypothetical protein
MMLEWGWLETHRLRITSCYGPLRCSYIADSQSSNSSCFNEFLNVCCKRFQVFYCAFENTRIHTTSELYDFCILIKNRSPEVIAVSHLFLRNWRSSKAGILKCLRNSAISWWPETRTALWPSWEMDTQYYYYFYYYYYYYYYLLQLSLGGSGPYTSNKRTYINETIQKHSKYK